MEIEQTCSASPLRASDACASPAVTTAHHLSGLDDLVSRVPAESASVMRALARAFAIAESGVGALALAHELLIDLAELETSLKLPVWATQLREMLNALLRSTTAPAVERDRATLNAQPKKVLRNFIDRPKDAAQPAASQFRSRAMRMFRALLALRYLSSREAIPGALASEFFAWRTGSRGRRLSAPALRAGFRAGRTAGGTREQYPGFGDCPARDRTDRCAGSTDDPVLAHTAQCV